MTKRWKLKTNSSNILLVLITLILVKAECTKGKQTNSIEGGEGENPKMQDSIYVGNDEIAEYFFGSSTNNNSFVLEGVNKCLDNFQLTTCIKMLLLSRINDVGSHVEDPSVIERDIPLLKGLLVFKFKNDTPESDFPDHVSSALSLDEEIAAKVKKIFWRRSLTINFLPKVQIEIVPAFKKSDFVCFSYTIRNELDSTEGRGRKKKGGGMPMMMIVPPLIMLGLMPFTLASLKAMVMNAVMINMMALNGAIFMTIRNLVFGPRHGDNVKYVNYGYSKDRQTQSKRPVLIIHSPAAFVKQPPVHKKRVHGQHHHHHHHHHHPSSSKPYQTIQYGNDYEYEYYNTEQDGGHHKRQGQRRNELSGG